MNPWLWLAVRVLFVGAWARAGWLDSLGPSDFPLQPFQLLFLLLASAWGARFHLLRPYLQADRKDPWLKPSWFESPGDLNQPFQFFHMCAWAFVAMAITGWLHSPETVNAASPNLPIYLLPGAFGVGLLLGMNWAVRSYPDNFVRSKNGVT